MPSNECMVAQRSPVGDSFLNHLGLKRKRSGGRSVGRGSVHNVSPCTSGCPSGSNTDKGKHNFDKGIHKLEYFFTLLFCYKSFCNGVAFALLILENNLNEACV